MTTIHDCLLSSKIERLIFSSDKSDCHCPDDVCAICQEQLINSGTGCCGTYAKKLQKCGHWFHVSCHIDANPDRHKCSVCRAQLMNPIKLENGIKITQLMNNIPYSLKAAARKGLRQSLPSMHVADRKWLMDQGSEFVDLFDAEYQRLQQIDSNLDW